MLFILVSYLKYIINVNSKYQIHSPFVYDFVTKCLEKPTNRLLLEKYLLFKNDLKKNKNFIEVKDFGAGSKVFKSNIRKIKDIARVAGMTNLKAKYLLKIINYFQPKTVLEIGTSLGIGTYVLALANPNSRILTIEGCENTSKMAQNFHNHIQLKSIQYLIGEFDELIPKVLQSDNIDCIFFDGNHTTNATLHYFTEALKYKKNDSIFIFDDIHWSKEMEFAWNKIIDNVNVTVSIDLYHIGIIFFKKELSKQHFIL